MIGAMVLKLVEQGLVGACVLGAAFAVVAGFLALVSWLWTMDWFQAAVAWTCITLVSAGMLGGLAVFMIMVGQAVFP